MHTHRPPIAALHPKTNAKTKANRPDPLTRTLLPLEVRLPLPRNIPLRKVERESGDEQHASEAGSL